MKFWLSLILSVAMISTTALWGQTYDFMPGEKVIFEDDFNKDTLSAFPHNKRKYALVFMKSIYTLAQNTSL